MAETVSRLEIRGVVQGVGYRWAMVEQARRIGVRGWVRNRPDGSVEAMVAGPSETVDRMVAWARKGPRASVVDTVDVFSGAGPSMRSTSGQRHRRLTPATASPP